MSSFTPSNYYKWTHFLPIKKLNGETVKEKQNTWDHISKGDFAYCETVSKIEKTVWHRI